MVLDTDLIEKIGSQEYLIDKKRVRLIDETNLDKPTVTVTMITYNHEAFIAEAIEGVLSQKTDFNFVLLIGEDCSTDGTRQIVVDYQKRYPSKVILKLPDENLGVTVNSVSNKLLSTGEFIAECEGDDFWCDENKLQRQVSFLKGNDGFSFVYHAVKTLKMSELDTDYNYPKIEGSVLTLDQAIHHHFVPTASLVFRMSHFNIKPWFYDKRVVSGDILNIMTLLLKGDGYFLNDEMATYRRSQGSITKTSLITDELRVLKNYLFIYENLDKESKGFYRHIFKLKIVPHRMSVLLRSARVGRVKDVIVSLITILKYDPIYPLRRLLSKVKTSFANQNTIKE